MADGDILLEFRSKTVATYQITTKRTHRCYRIEYKYILYHICLHETSLLVLS